MISSDTFTARHKFFINYIQHLPGKREEESVSGSTELVPTKLPQRNRLSLGEGLNTVWAEGSLTATRKLLSTALRDYGCTLLIAMH